MRRLGGERVVAGLRDRVASVVQLGRVEADHAGQRLAVGEAGVGDQRVGGARGDLDMIAEHAVVADLERGDAGLAA